MTKTVNDKTAITFSMRAVILLAGLLLTLSAGFWQTQRSIDANQHAIAMALQEMRQDREKLTEHLRADVIRRPADVHEVLRDRNSERTVR